jgi:hypothetical protein
MVGVALGRPILTRPPVWTNAAGVDYDARSQ